MNRTLWLLSLGITLHRLFIPVSSLEAGEPGNADLALRAQSVLRQYCYRCHGLRFEVDGLNLLNRDDLLDSGYYVVSGQPGASEIWQRSGVKRDMPPKNSPRPSADELATLRRWIEAGAPPFPQDELRPFVSDADVLRAIRDDLRGSARESRRFLRYFTLANLHNNSFAQRIGRSGRNVATSDLRLARAALSKVINSLSWERQIVLPVGVDQQQTVYRIDLRDLGWDDRNQWFEILKRYPYGLRLELQSDNTVRELALQVYQLSEADQPLGGGLPYVRADWFIDTATRPPLYHTLLELPQTSAELEETLQVDVERDFLRDRLARAGFSESGVSQSNRLVDRHNALFGAYWKSYDFRKSDGRGDLFRFPLGPAFGGNTFSRQAFEHDGGEIIFNLPNGLQAYLLVDNQGNRIDKGPIDVVRDLKETAGTAEVVNGISCMNCHDGGMKPFTDTIRQGLAVGGEAALKVQQLFPTKDRMDQLLAADSDRFLQAAQRATASFLQVGSGKDRPWDEFGEPVGQIARLYQADLRIEEAAAELGIESPQTLQALIRGNRVLKQLGLGPLAERAAIKRSKWDSRDSFISLFQRTASEIERGLPHLVR